MPRNPTLVPRGVGGWAHHPPLLPTCRFCQIFFFFFFKYNKSLKDPVRGAVQIWSYRNRQNGNLARKVRNALPMCKALSQYSGTHIYTLLTVWFCSPTFHSVLAVVWHVLGGASPRGAWVWFFKDSFFSVTLRPSTGWVGGGGRASEAGNRLTRCGKEERLWCPSLSLIGAFLLKVTN